MAVPHLDLLKIIKGAQPRAIMSVLLQRTAKAGNPLHTTVIRGYCATLIKHGFLTAGRPDPTHKNVVYYTLTEQGKKAVQD